MKTISSFFILCLFLASPTMAQVGLGVDYDNGTVNLGMSIMNSFLENPADHSIIIQADMLGDCDVTFIVPGVSFPMPDYMAYQEMTATFPATQTDRCFMYTAVGLDPNGEPYSLPGAGDVREFGFAGADDAVIARGILVMDNFGDVYFEPCEDRCWYATYPYCYLDMQSADPGWEDLANSGQLVNLYGRAYADGMPGAPCVFVSRVVEENGVGGCDAVATDKKTWGQLKAIYR